MLFSLILNVRIIACSLSSKYIKSKAYCCLVARYFSPTASWDNDCLLKMAIMGGVSLWGERELGHSGGSPGFKSSRPFVSRLIEVESPQHCNYPRVYLRKQRPASSFRWGCVRAQSGVQPQQGGADLRNQSFPGYLSLTALLLRGSTAGYHPLSMD